MSLNVSSLNRYYNYSNLINMTSALHNNANNNTSSVQNKTNNYNNILNSFNTSSRFNETFSKKLNELQTYTKDSKEFYSDFVNNFSELKKSANALKAYSPTSVFKAENYGSNNSNVVAVTKAGSNETSDYKVEVSQLAAGKSISYNELASTGNELVTAAAGSISINNGQNSYNFNVDTQNASNNKDAMNKIADKVNKADIGVKATIEEKDGKSSLKFEAAATGINSKLEVAFGNDLSSKLNVKAVEEGKNAVYKVNGTAYSSESNNVNISSTVKASLKSVGKAEISANNIDSSKVVNAVKNFAEDYNKVVGFLDDNSNKSTKIDKLAESFGFTSYSSSSLSSIGITVGADGKLSINEKNLKEAINNDYKNVKDILGGTSGIANQTYSKVQDAMYNSKDLYPSFQFDSGSGPIYSYKNPNTLYSQYSALFSGGFFLNSLI